MGNIGKVVQVIGPVVDVEFEEDHLPEIYNALVLDQMAGDIEVKLTAEVSQHIGRNQVRAISMASVTERRPWESPVSPPFSRPWSGMPKRFTIS